MLCKIVTLNLDPSADSLATREQKQMIDSPNLARVAAHDWTILEYLERINPRAHEIAALVWTRSGMSKLAA